MLVIRSKKYPDLLWPMKIVGTRTLTDTLHGYLVSRSRFRTGIGLFGAASLERTVTYDERGRRLKKEVIRNGRRTTVEYLDAQRVKVARQQGVQNQ